jgi:hypothetical protein
MIILALGWLSLDLSWIADGDARQHESADNGKDQGRGDPELRL